MLDIHSAFDTSRPGKLRGLITDEFVLILLF